MGGGTFDYNAYRAYASTTRGKSTDEIYRARAINADLNPLGVKLRESRDSVDNPRSTPLIVGIDVTGSMGIIADTLAREGLGTLFRGVLERKPISDPHVMFMAIGDAYTDRAPLQVSQFEADNRIVQQLASIYLEHGGGSNDFESYNLPWYFAAMHTKHDSMEKRGKRGYLFTVGDEEAPKALTKEQLKKICGDDAQADMSSLDLLHMAQRSYDVFHIVIEQGSYASRAIDRVMSSWTPLLGQRVIRLSDYTKLAETIVSAIEVAEGRDASDSAAGWGSGSSAVLAAVKGIDRIGATRVLGGPR